MINQLIPNTTKLLKFVAFSFFSMALLATTYGQIEMQLDHEGEYRKVTKIGKASFTVVNEKGRNVRAVFTKSRFEQSAAYAEGFVEVNYGKQKQMDIEKSNTSKMNKNLFEMEISVTSDRNLNQCFYVLLFSSNGTMATFYDSIGSLQAGRPKTLKIKMPAHVDQIGSLHVFSEGDEVKTNRSVPNRSLGDEFKELSKQFQGVPITALFYDARYFPHKLSPDGLHFATVRDRGTHNELLVFDTTELKMVQSTAIGEFDEKVTQIEWLNDDTLLYLHEGDLKSLTVSDGMLDTLKKTVSAIIMILDDSENVIIDKNGDIYKFNCLSKKTTTVSSTYVGSQRWLDNEGNYRLRSRYENSKVMFDYRESPKSKWISLDETCNEEGLKFNYQSDGLLDQKTFIDAFGTTPSLLIIYSKHKTDTLALYEYNLKTGLIEKEIYNDEIYDLGGPDIDDTKLLYSKKNELLGITYWKDKLNVEWFREDFKETQKIVDQALSDTCNIPIEWTDDASIILYRSFSSKHPGKYFLFRKKQFQLQALLDLKPLLKHQDLASCAPLRFKARDGKSIYGYLNLPPNRKDDAPLPLIVMPHGGPTARDYWQYDPIIQFLSTRGYAVLQVNYRGSSGYGEEHTKEGLIGNIDTIPIDDIVDGTRLLIERGIADPERVCVMGSSWGGYSTYMCMIRYPKLFKCGVAFAAPSDLGKMLNFDRYVGNSYGRLFWAHLLKESVDEEEYIEKVSPINHVDKFEGPVLIIHGEHDYRVSVNQAKIMKQALLNADKDCSLILLPESGHGWSETDINHFLNEAEAFISKHLKNSA